MIHYPTLSPAPDRRACTIGLIYWAFSMTLLGFLISAAGSLLGLSLSAGKINFIYYCLNFAAAMLIFRRFWASNWRAALDRMFPTVYYAVLGYLGSRVLTQLVTLLCYRIDPGFANINDQNIYAMLTEDPALMAIGTAFLAPVAEEIFYRGVIWRKLFDKNRILAYIVTIALFSGIHVLNYVGVYPALQLVLCFVQYIPAAYCLCWCYRQTGTILSPILMHILVNAVSVYSIVR